MSSIKRRELKALLNGLSKEQIIEQIAALCDAVPQAADFYRTKLRAEDDATVAREYKEKIRREFARWSTGGFRLSSARKLVTDFARIAGSAGTAVDVMLTYVEEGLGCRPVRRRPGCELRKQHGQHVSQRGPPRRPARPWNPIREAAKL